MTSEVRSTQYNSPAALRLLTYFKYSTLVTAIAAMLMLALAVAFTHAGLLIMGLVLMGDRAWRWLPSIQCWRRLNAGPSGGHCPEGAARGLGQAWTWST